MTTTFNVAYMLTASGITVHFNGRPYMFNKTSPNYRLILDALKAKDTAQLEVALDIRKTVADATQRAVAGISDDLVVNGTQVTFRGRNVTGALADRIVASITEGLDVAPIRNFLRNLFENPSKRSVDETFGFAQHNNLPLTEDGHLLAYKKVRGDYLDCHSGTISNAVGQIVEMARNEVDDDQNRTCSSGLHFCSYEYLSHFGGERIVVLKINPRDIVSIPTDYNNSKGRCCRYEVVDELAVDNRYQPVSPLRDGIVSATGGITAGASSDYSRNSLADFSEEQIAEIRENHDDNVSIYNYSYAESVTELAGDWDTSEDLIKEVIASVKRPAVKKVADTGKQLTGAKIGENEVRQIRTMLKDGNSLSAISKVFDISPRSIARIRDGEAWSHVK